MHTEHYTTQHVFHAVIETYAMKSDYTRFTGDFLLPRWHVNNCIYICSMYVCTRVLYRLKVNGNGVTVRGRWGLVRFGALGTGCPKVGPVYIESQGDVQCNDRSHGGCYVHFDFGNVEELVQNEALQHKEGQHGQENDKHAVEEHCLEGAVVLRVLGIQNKQGIS